MRISLKVKHVLLMWVLLFLLSWIIYSKYSTYVDKCREMTTKTVICDRYKKGIITGSLCESLCENQALVFLECLSNSAEHQVYTGVIEGGDKEKKDKQLIIKHDMKRLLNYDLSSSSSLYDKPEKGSSMDDFRVMLSAFLEFKLGVGDYQSIQDRLLNIADINYDGKVSLAEAKSIWALLQNNDFFTMMVLDSDHVPRLEGFCGDMYAIEKVQTNQMFGIDLPALLDLFIPSGTRHAMDYWFLPSWPQRVRVAVGLLEFVEEIFDNPNGNFFLCSIDQRSIGFTNKYDVKILKLQDILPENVLKQKLHSQKCTLSQDCAYKSCAATCDLSTQHCTADVVHPNLQKVCQLVTQYVLTGAPAKVTSQLEDQLSKCTGLNNNSGDIQLEHSLILHELKSLLWKHIANVKFEEKVTKSLPPHH